MIVVMTSDHKQEQLQHVLDHLSKFPIDPRVVPGEGQTTICLLGKVEQIDQTSLRAMEGVQDVVRISKPFKLASLETQPNPSSIEITSELSIGPGAIVVMAGPCSVESEDQTLRIARAVKAAGANLLRGGAFKPRSSPYSFQGLGKKGLEILALARKETGLPVITEAMDTNTLDLVAEYADIIQVGARSMQNFPLLKELGRLNKPVMLKRGMSASIEEFLMSAEYILAEGNHNVILCERGIRSFDQQFSRNCLDLNAVPILKSLSHLPIIIDPSHGTGKRHLVSPMYLASIAAGADGVIVEVHDRPEEALSDGPQALLPDDFEKLMAGIKSVSAAVGRNVAG